MKKLLLLLLIIVIASTAKQSLAQTNVSGGIYANTTWTLAGSPYIVTSTVVVFPGYTLTIDPGVTVKFDNGQGLELRQAQLIAIGTAIDSITFTSSSATPTPGIWSEIFLNGGSASSKFNYCNFKYAQYAINGGPVDTLKNSNFTQNNYGYYTYYTSYIDSCSFTYHTLAVRRGTFNHCTIMYNQNGAGELTDGYQINLINSRIDSNQTGFCASYSTAYNCTFNNNQIGIDFGIDGGNTYRNCTIDSNSFAGVKLSDDSIVNCNIMYNATGIYAGGRLIAGCAIKYNSLGMSGSGSDVHSNIIEANTIGVAMSAPGNFYCNKICNNSSYDLQLTGSGSINLPNNYWCTPDSASTEAVIYDGYDNISLGLVHFMPLDTNNCYLTGCNVTLTPHVANATCDTCHNGHASVSVTNGFPPYSYSWFTSPIQTTATATGLASGTYTVCVTDGHGCTACNYNVFVDSTNCTGFGVSTTATNASCSLCNDGMAIAHVNAGSPPFVYTWYTSPIQSNDTAFNLAAGTYAVCVTDLYGCAACDTVTIGIGSCGAYYTISNAGPHTYDCTNMASGTPPLTYDWNWGDGSPHDTAAYPTHTYAGAGTYNICLSITDSAGCTANYCHSFYLLTPLSPVLINVIPPTTTGINEAGSAKAFSIYPNPANSTLTIQSKEAIENIAIRGIDGRVVKSLVFGHWSLVEIDLGDLSSGIYFIEVNKTGRQRFIKQ